MKVKILIPVLVIWKAFASSTTHSSCPPQNGPGGAIHLSHPTNCAQFVTCDWGRAVVRDCAPGTLWNNAVQTCDHPRNVKCYKGTTVVPTRSPIETTTVVSTTVANGRCPSVVDANNPIFLPHFDCSRFYVCTLKGPVEMRCNEGFHWSIRTDHCERPWDAWCVTSAALPMTNDGCPSEVDPSNPVFLPHPDRSKIYICVNGIGRMELSCAEGLFWSTEGCVSGTGNNMSSSTPGILGTTATITQSSSTVGTGDPTEAEENFTTDSYNYV